MDEIADTYSLQTIEQLRIVADPLRIRIFEMLAQRPMTATQVGEELQIAAPKAHYHVRELERIGLARLVETRERGGILEKYYRAVARNLTAPPQLLKNSQPGEVAATIAQLFGGISRDFIAALERISAVGVESFDHYLIGLGGESVWMTPEEFRATLTAADALFAPYRKRRGIPGEREAQVTLIGYDTQLASHSEATASQTDAAPQPTPPPAQRPRLRPVVVVGMLTYSRDDLARVIASGDQLDLNVVGYLSFSADVTPDLIERAVGRLRYRGVLSAPADVRTALQTKEVEAS